MPTAKQTRYHIKKLMKLRFALQEALNAAHEAGVIDYPDAEYKEQSPCKVLWEVKERIEKTTERAIVTAYRNEVLKELKQWH